ncbi:hypothetical protein B7P43_G15897 [Cryptotermes secundus]|uniref:Uncharacterized protein n=1 Tax=Cryptotermes secundus TaxID=105785 RepID=A0A2J7R6I2_9NEOP|nr:hypothetical protein B7P43_G15897 [Cryptotermes secundus]
MDVMYQGGAYHCTIMDELLFHNQCSRGHNLTCCHVLNDCHIVCVGAFLHCCIAS